MNCPVCEDRIPKNSPTSYDSVWSETHQAWVCRPCAEVEADQKARGVLPEEDNS